MKMKDFKNATKKKKLILLGAVASLGIIILGIGLGVGLSNGDDPVDPNTGEENPDPNTGGGTDTGGETPDPNTGGGGTTTTPTTPITEGANWKVVEEVDSSDTSKQIKVLKISNNISGEEDGLTEISKELSSKGIDVTTINEIHFPFRLKQLFEEDKIRELLKIVNLTNDNIGYVLYENDYQEALANGSTSTAGQYQDEKLVELILPGTIKSIPNHVFKNNKIKKVNWNELVNLESIGNGAFYINNFSDGVDLSKLTKLKIIGSSSFQDATLRGTLKLPPNIKSIGQDSFSSLDTSTNNGEHQNALSGTLVIPPSLESIGDRAFIDNDLSEVDFSNATNLKIIGEKAFENNLINSHLNLGSTTTPKLTTIGKGAFGGLNKNTIHKNTTFPYTLTTIGEKAFKVQDNITIKVLNFTKGINVDSFSNNTTITIDRSVLDPMEDAKWKIVDSGKTLRVKGGTSRDDLARIKTDLRARGIDTTSIKSLHLPYTLKSVNETQIKLLLNTQDINNDNIGYILHKADYNVVDAGNGIRNTSKYRYQKLVEVNLPETITSIPRDAFEYNNIKKVNFDELVNLEEIGTDAFFRNKFTNGLDLSKMTSLKTIGDYSFAEATITGELKLPPNVVTIELYAFSYDGSVEYDSKNELGYNNNIIGKLVLPSSLVTIEKNAFEYNNIEVLDWNKAESLETIDDRAFASNQLKTLVLNLNVLPKINRIGEEAFKDNPGQDEDKSLLLNDFKLPSSIKIIGKNAIKTRTLIYITIPFNTSSGITKDSFGGNVNLTKP